jgi:chromosome partitioning protein
LRDAADRRFGHMGFGYTLAGFPTVRRTNVYTLLIANPKGGSGKTTLATNIAGFLAGKRQRVVLADDDRQQSSNTWLARRPALFPKIHGKFADKQELKEFDPQWLVIDSPAGIDGAELRTELRRANALVIPISPSLFDMAATARFLQTIAENNKVAETRVPVALVATRVDARTRSAAELDEFLAATGLPVITHLRDTQVYVACARDGLSVFDLPRSRGEQDQEQWRPLTRWIGKHISAK